MDALLLFHNRVLKNFGDICLDSRGNVTPALSSESGMSPGGNPLVPLDGGTGPQQSKAAGVVQK